jgi:hypothetical protein
MVLGRSTAAPDGGLPQPTNFEKVEIDRNQAILRLVRRGPGLILVNAAHQPANTLHQFARRDAMRAIHSLKGAIRKIASQMVSARGRSAFYCGQCEQWERCGLPPNKNCITMLAQIERNGGKSSRRIARWHAGLGA